MDIEPRPQPEVPLEIAGIDFSSLSAVSGPAPAAQPPVEAEPEFDPFADMELRRDR